MIKVRTFPEKNYRGIFVNGKTIRVALDPKKPIEELDFPEFYDVKITDKCNGRCPYCYMDSTPEGAHVLSTVWKISEYFGRMSVNERPFQVAIGGGEPTMSPEFETVLKTFSNLGIVPNYTTNGMFVAENYADSIIGLTIKYCGGVAVSCHEHLDIYWKTAACVFAKHKIKLNFHIIISDAASADRFREIYNEFQDIVDYFVLLPYGAQGRAEHKDIDWEYLCSVMPDDVTKIAFGANFHPYLQNTKHPFNVSLYEPESMSKFLDLQNMTLYPSSFNLTPLKIFRRDELY